MLVPGTRYLVPGLPGAMLLQCMKYPGTGTWYYGMYQVPAAGTTVCTRYQHRVLPDFASFVVCNADSTGLVFILGKKQAMK